MNKEIIKDCIDEIKAIAKLIDDVLFQQYGEHIIITSGLRFEDDEYYNPKSYHSFGLAFDFTFLGVIFEWSYYVYQIVKNFNLNGYTVREMEIVRDKNGRQHCHISIDIDKPIRFFTKTYT